MNYINTILNNDTAYNGQASQLTNHLRAVYSRELMWNAQPVMAFLQFADEKTELNTQPGMTITMMTYADLARGSALTEGTPMGTKSLSATTQTLTVAEHGNAVAVTELALQTSFTNLMDDIVKALSRNVALTVDCDIRDVACAGAVINGVSTPTIYGRADKTVTPVSAPGSVTSAHVLSTAVIKDAVELLATANAPKFAGGYYVCIVSPHQSRTLRDDAAWLDALKYTTPDNILNAEIGRIDNVRFIESSVMPNGAVAATDIAYDATLANAGASGIDLYKAVVFGESYYGFAVGLPVELRDGGVTDFGRSHAMGWYSIYGCAILNPNRGVVLVTS